jgi:hypothetical protein
MPPAPHRFFNATASSDNDSAFGWNPLTMVTFFPARALAIDHHRG